MEINVEGCVIGVDVWEGPNGHVQVTKGLCHGGPD